VRELAFLVCGGHAVMAHGFARSTFDLDLLVRSTAREAWKTLMRELGWQLHAEGTTFLQFDSPPGQLEPVDLMLVNDSTFAQMSAAALPLSRSTGGAKVVSLLHLVALKCHAIKHGHAGRVEKDVDDVIQLVKVNHLSLENEKLRGIILKHGIPELYEKLQRFIRKE
jgi:hypothetical protein